MGAVGMLAFGEIRRRWRSLVALALLVGVVGAVVLASAAGARRSDSALTRFNVATRVDDAELLADGPLGYTPTAAQLTALRQTPGVAAVAVLRFYAVTPVRVPPNVISSGLPAALDARFGTEIDRGHIVAGRAANPAVADEIDLGEQLAQQLHRGVGGHIDAVSYSPAAFARAAASGGGPPPNPDGPRLRLHIVGLVGPGDLGLAGQVVVLTPAFNRAYFHRIGNFGVLMAIRTIHGASDVPRVVAAARNVFRPSGGVNLQSPSDANQGAQNAIDVLTLALWIFGGVVALAGIVTVGIVLTREISANRGEQPTLRALGLTRRQRVLISAPRALLVAGIGGVLAVLGAVIASPLFPIGLARRADPDVGVHVDWVVLVLGAVAVAAAVLVVASVAAIRNARRADLDAAPERRRRASRVVDASARAGLAPSVTNGLRMALDPGRGDDSVPIRSAYLGAVLGVLGVVAVLVFASSLDHLVTTPGLYGSPWDFHAIDTKFNNDVTGCDRSDFGLAQTSGVAAVAAVCTNDITLDRRGATGWGFTSLKGTIEPTVVAGRAPRASDEVALGATTLHAAGKRIGDTVSVRGPHGNVHYRIVGQALFPTFDNSASALGDGAAFTGPGLARIFDGNGSSNRYLLGRYRPGANRTTTSRSIAAIPRLSSFGADIVPLEVDRLRHIGWFPVTLATLLGALALVAVGHALVTGVRRRRRELALLKTLGFDRGQVRATVAWQATTLAAVGLVVGIPIGLIVGSVVWRLVAEGLGGVSTTATVPALVVFLVIPAVLLLVNLTAYFPARTAAQTRPAVALRSE